MKNVADRDAEENEQKAKEELLRAKSKEAEPSRPRVYIETGSIGGVGLGGRPTHGPTGGVTERVGEVGVA